MVKKWGESEGQLEFSGHHRDEAPVPAGVAKLESCVADTAGGHPPPDVGGHRGEVDTGQRPREGLAMTPRATRVQSRQSLEQGRDLSALETNVPLLFLCSSCGTSFCHLQSSRDQYWSSGTPACPPRPLGSPLPSWLQLTS